MTKKRERGEEEEEHLTPELPFRSSSLSMHSQQDCHLTNETNHDSLSKLQSKVQKQFETLQTDLFG